jgi:hypothetical protein
VAASGVGEPMDVMFSQQRMTLAAINTERKRLTTTAEIQAARHYYGGST